MYMYMCRMHGACACRLQVLLTAVDTISSLRVTKLAAALLLLECVVCVKALMNSRLGMQHLIQRATDFGRRLVRGEHEARQS